MKNQVTDDPQLLILGADYATGNMGVDALLSGTIASAVHARPRMRIRLLTYGRHSTAQAAQVPIDQINLRFSWKLTLPNNVMRLLAVAWVARVHPRVGGWLIARHPALGEIRRASLCVAIAGGDSFSDIYGWRRFSYICLPQLLVLALGRPLVLLPQTLGPFKARIAARIAGAIMRRAAVVFSRDAEGLEVAKRMRPPVHAEFSADMGFALHPQAPASGLPDWVRAADGRLIGLNVSGLLYFHRNPAGMFGIRGDYRTTLEDLVIRLTTRMEFHVVLVTHVTGAGESDADACADFHARLKDRCGERLVLASGGYNHREIKHLIGHCRFFIGARMHACIAALSQGIPAAGMAYSRKFAGVFESIGAGELVVDLRDHDGPAVVERLVELIERQDEFAATLVPRAAEARAAALGLFGRLASHPSSQHVREIVPTL
jgi:polysaccharide pyruvyl transferase WcaK-like protein